MLKLLCEAQLPLVAVRTRDVLNFTDVVRELVGKFPIEFTPQTVPDKFKIYYFVQPRDEKTDWSAFYRKLYPKFVAEQSTLLIVNPREVQEPMFDGGEVPVPRSLLVRLMEEVVSSKKVAMDLLPGFGGCTIKEAIEFARITMARDASLTPQGVVKTRKEVFKDQKGLTLVDTAQTLYLPPQPLHKWIMEEKGFFLSTGDPRLVPRGLLFDGPPGTGKSAGAKFVAEQLGVPLYRLDIGATKGKYVGESENSLMANLARVDHEEPCVLLLDEVEKVFGDHADGGTTASMLSQLLWWLAEHRSRVLTIMTTNKSDSLPKELYRDGRVDKQFWFAGLPKDEAFPFVKALLGTFGTDHDEKDVTSIIAKAFSSNGTMAPQAAVYSATVAHIKSAATAHLTKPKLLAVSKSP